MGENGQGSNRNGGAERDGKRNVQQEKEPATHYEEQGPLHAGANRASVRASVRAVIQEGGEATESLTAASPTEADGLTGMERKGVFGARPEGVGRV